MLFSLYLYYKFTCMENKKIIVLKEDYLNYKNAVKIKGDNRYYVYMHFILGDMYPFYIGRGCEYRLSDKDGRNKKWNYIFNNNIVHVRVHTYNLSKEDSVKLELKLINEYDLDNLANISKGGEEGAPGENNYFYGKKLYGELNGNYGNRYSRNPLSKPVYQLDLNNNIIKEYSSVSETELDGFISQNVNDCCLKKRKTHRGYQFIYKSNYKNITEYVPGITNPIKIDCYDKNNNFIKTYDSISQTKIDGFSPNNVQQVLKGKKKSHKNRIFIQHKI